MRSPETTAGKKLMEQLGYKSVDRVSDRSSAKMSAKGNVQYVNQEKAWFRYIQSID